MRSAGKSVRPVCSRLSSTDDHRARPNLTTRRCSVDGQGASQPGLRTNAGSPQKTQTSFSRLPFWLHGRIHPRSKVGSPNCVPRCRKMYFSNWALARSDIQLWIYKSWLPDALLVAVDSQEMIAVAIEIARRIAIEVWKVLNPVVGCAST